MPFWASLAVCLVGCVAVPVPPHHKWTWQLGQEYVRFNATSHRSPASQDAFLVGVAQLYNFLYPIAQQTFLQVLEEEPDTFPMAWWGVAMTCWQPLWMSEQHTGACERAEVALSEISSGVRGAQRWERDYAAGLLAYMQNHTTASRSQRLQRHMRSMLLLVQRRPSDLEASILLALALLAHISPGEWGFESRGSSVIAASKRSAFELCRATLSKALQVAPRHPHALHLVTHLLDSPRHAALGLEWAETYSQVASNGYHALHMPSHLYLRLGNWSQATAHNQRAVQCSERFIQAHQLQNQTALFLDSHSAQFLHYSFLQQGRYREALQLLERERALGHGYRAAQMGALQLVETADWARLQMLSPRLTCASCNDTANLDDLFLLSNQVNAASSWARGLAMFNTGNISAARHSLSSLQQQSKALYAPMPLFAQFVGVSALQLQAAIQASEPGGMASAIKLALQAVQQQTELGAQPYGWPVVLPAEELAARLLLQDSRPAEAVQVLLAAPAVEWGADLGRASYQLLLAEAHAATGATSQACRVFESLAEQLADGDAEGRARSRVLAWLAEHAEQCSQPLA